MALSLLQQLARLIRLRHEQSEDPYVLFLGSGASLPSGRSDFAEMVRVVVGSDDVSAFYEHLDSLSAIDRIAVLREHLSGVAPSLGYRYLAELIKAGYFGLIFTTNVDSLLEDSLVSVGLPPSEFLVLVNGQDREERIAQLIAQKHPRIKIVKLHGDLRQGVVALTPKEIFEFPREVDTVLRKYLNDDLLIVGYSSRDMSDVNRCLESKGGTLWYVDPIKPDVDNFLYSAMVARGQEHNLISGADGEFDRFFGELHRELLQGALEPSEPLSASSGTTMLTAYLQAVVDAYSTVDLRWCMRGSVGKLPIGETIVSPRLSAPHPLPVAPLAFRGKVPNLEHLARRPSVGWEEALSACKHLLVVGEIGTGKSVLAQLICHSVAKRALQDSELPHKSVLPVFLPLFELDEYLTNYEHNLIDGTQESPVIHFLRDYYHILYNLTFPTEFWSNLFEEHKCLVVFDGLDEVSTPDRRLHIVRLVERLMAEYPLLQSVSMLRPEVYDPSVFNGSYQVSISIKLDQSGQEELLTKLEAGIQSALDQVDWPEPEALAKFKRLLHVPELEDKLRTPLFLTAAFFHYAYLGIDADIEITSVQERLIELALNGWDSIKVRTTNILFDGLSLGQSQYDPSEELELLSYLAWDLYKTTNGVEIADREFTIDPLVNWLMENDRNLGKRSARQYVLPFLEAASARSGVLKALYKASSSHRFAFHNEADVVFLAARYLADDIESRQELLLHLLDAEWNRLVFAVSDLLSLRSINSANQFLDFILQDALPKHVEQRAAQILLAARCLIRAQLDLFSVKDEIVRHILDILRDRQQPTPLQTRIGLGQVLGYLGDPRIGEMTLVAKGSFYMGYDLFPEDRPSHVVMLDDFYIDKYPVTNAQFEVFIGEGGYANSEYWSEEGWNWVQQTQRKCPQYWDDLRFNLPNYPVVGVSWYEASAYAKWAGKRLPTEEEWEKAARGPTRYEWPWGNEFRSSFVNVAEGEERVDDTTPIGIYPAGASYYGVLDMSGNVSEWTDDWYRPYPGSMHEDPRFGERFKVRRGGGWGWDRDFARCTCRVPSLPTADYAVIGFRCCTTLRP